MSDRRDRNIRSTMRLRRLRRLRSFKSRTSHCSCYSLTSLCSSRSYSSSLLTLLPSRRRVHVLPTTRPSHRGWLARVVPGDSGELSGGLFSTFGNLYYYKYGIDGIGSGISALAFWYIFIHYLQIKGVKICLWKWKTLPLQRLLVYSAP